MRVFRHGFYLVGSIVLTSIMIAAGCQPPATNTGVANTATVNTNTNLNTNSNSSSTTTTVSTREPDQYQANVRLSFETLGDTQKATLPTLGAMVARSGADRVMEFALPTGE